jgi:hypothetical protein
MIDIGNLQKGPLLSFGINIVARAGTAVEEGQFNGFTNGLIQITHLTRGKSLPETKRQYGRPEETLIGVNITKPSNITLVKEKGLNWPLPFPFEGIG